MTKCQYVLDQFFPSDIDFSSFYNVEAGSFDGSSYNDDMDYLLTLDSHCDIISNSTLTETKNEQIPVKGAARLSSEPVIMIPPLLPARLNPAISSNIKIKQEPNKGSTLANSKFLKSSKPGKNLGMPNESDDDSDSDDDRIKRIKYDPNDPLRNERRYNPNPYTL